MKFEKLSNVIFTINYIAHIQHQKGKKVKLKLIKYNYADMQKFIRKNGENIKKRFQMLWKYNMISKGACTERSQIEEVNNPSSVSSF